MLTVTAPRSNGGPVYFNGAGGANNWPLKGGKMGNWDGGIRVNAWVSGGFLPPKVRGTKYDGLVARWAPECVGGMQHRFPAQEERKKKSSCFHWNGIPSFAIRTTPPPL